MEMDKLKMKSNDDTSSIPDFCGVFFHFSKWQIIYIQLLKEKKWFLLLPFPSSKSNSLKSALMSISKLYPEFVYFLFYSPNDFNNCLAIIF